MKLAFSEVICSLIVVLFGLANSQAQNSTIDQVVAATLHGPELKKMKFVNHDFIVKKAIITDRVTGITKIEGQISHHLLFRPDERFFYVIEKKLGRIIRAEFQVERETRTPHRSKFFKEIVKSSKEKKEPAIAI